MADHGVGNNNVLTHVVVHANGVSQDQLPELVVELEVGQERHSNF